MRNAPGTVPIARSRVPPREEENVEVETIDKVLSRGRRIASPGRSVVAVLIYSLEDKRYVQSKLIVLFSKNNQPLESLFNSMNY